MTKKLAIILVCISFVFITSCGKKAPPRAPNIIIPNPAKELSAHAAKQGVVLLEFKLPKKNGDGSAFDDLKAILVFRAAVSDMNSFCPSCDESYEMIYNGPATIINDIVKFTDWTATEKNELEAYVYKVKVANSSYNRRRYNRGLSGFSAPVKVSVNTDK